MGCAASQDGRGHAGDWRAMLLMRGNSRASSGLPKKIGTGEDIQNGRGELWGEGFFFFFGSIVSFLEVFFEKDESHSKLRVCMV